LFFEDPIERLHHQHLVATKRACCVREYETRETFIHSLDCASNSKEAQASMNDVERKRKRNFSEETIAKKTTKTLRVQWSRGKRWRRRMIL
jgi:hypothetical protein